MQVITSNDNQKVKYIVGLKEKKFRLMYGEYIAEGLRWVLDAIEHYKNASFDSISLIAVAQSQLEKYYEEIKAYDDKILVVSDRIFEKMSEEKNSQGILAVIKVDKEHPISGNYCLFLDRVRDPANLGTIFRTALAAGFKNILCYDCVDTFNSKVIRSSMTAILKLNIINATYDDLPELKKDGFKIVSADIHGKNIFAESERLDKVCLIVGNEANGIHPSLLNSSDLNYCIPMEGIESLNASVSAGILMYMLKYGK